MAYRIIETTTLSGRKRVQWKSTGHNGADDYLKRERKKQAARDRLKATRKPRYLGRAGVQ